MDETGWEQGWARAWLWVAVTTLVVAFVIRRTRGRSAFEDLRAGSSQVHTTDRYPVYTHLSRHTRQLCGAHLRRDFQAMIDRANGARGVGADLLGCSDTLFEHWYRVRDGPLSRATFRAVYVRGLRARARTHLERGIRCGCPKAAGTCRDRLVIEASLWTFARVPGVEPTNNAAEREVRHAVCWRKTRFGTASEAGTRFVEWVLTGIASCRRQERHVLTLLTDAVTAYRTGAPALIPGPAQQQPGHEPAPRQLLIDIHIKCERLPEQHRAS